MSECSVLKSWGDQMKVMPEKWVIIQFVTYKGNSTLIGLSDFV